MLTDLQKKELESGAYGIIQFNAPMSAWTSFKIGGPAEVLIHPSSNKELLRTVRFLRAEGLDYFLFGNGSNLLVSDQGISKPVIHLGKQFAETYAQGDIVHAKAGALLSSVAKLSFRNNLTGMEPVSGIPGSIGGAIYMNAGAYGREMKDIVQMVEVIDQDSNLQRLTPDELDFSYRHSAVQDQGWIVVEIELKLEEGDPQEIEAQYADFTERRTSKQPLTVPSAGSAFKRPYKGYASAMIEEAGLKGFSIGGAQVSEKHAGFIVNKGNATAADVVALVEEVAKRVEDQFGVRLQAEMKMVGDGFEGF